jgi:hypothetical protein
VDAIISNCVINLSPDKPQVWRDVFLHVARCRSAAPASDVSG